MNLTEDEITALQYIGLGEKRRVLARSNLYRKELIFCPYDEPCLTEEGEQVLAEMRRP